MKKNSVRKRNLRDLRDIVSELGGCRPIVGPDRLTEIGVAFVRQDFDQLLDLAVDALHDLRVRRRDELHRGSDPLVAETLLEAERIIAMELIPHLWPQYEQRIRDKAGMGQTLAESEARRSDGQGVGA